MAWIDSIYPWLLRKRKNAEEKERRAKFKRGEPLATKQLPDRKLRGKLRYSEKLAGEAAAEAAQADEWLLPSDAGTLEADGMERTWRFSQNAIVQEVGAGAARKVFDLKLTELGPYNLAFTRNGRHMLLGGRKGHLAVMDWQSMRTVCELQVRETVRDVRFLHNEQYFAAAQKKYVYIYDKRGLEVHCLKEHTGVHRLDFLPYHFLLTSVGEGGVLRYQDTSTGHLVAQHRTRLGDCDVMRHNPYNAVVSLGHANGTVSMWTPNVTTPVVKMLCHRGAVSCLAMDGSGRHMATAGLDGQLKLWDLRMLKPLHAYLCARPASSLDISQRGMLAVGFGRRVQVWRDALASKAKSPYMNHELAGGALRTLAFCPYEDVLAAGHVGGLSTLLVPGAGEPNFDSLVADPYEKGPQRREREVHQLLQKLQPDMIVLDPTTIGQVKREPKEVAAQSRAAAAAANSVRRKAQLDAADEKSKMKGKNKPSRKTARRKAALRNIVDENSANQKEKAAAAQQAKNAKPTGPSLEEVPRALHRFYKKAVIGRPL